MTLRAVVIFPGASLMDIRQEGTTLHVRCPGCQATTSISADQAGSLAFAHEDKCRVHARIAKAISVYERQVVRRG